MSLINWTSAVKIEYDDSDDEQQALLHMLARPASNIERWEGKVKRKMDPSTKQKRNVIEVRKNIDGIAVLVAIDPLLSRTNRDVIISANGKMFFTVDEVAELNLVVKEAYSAFKSLRKS